MIETTECDAGCGRPTQGAGVWLCEECTARVESLLAEIPRLVPVLHLIARGIEKPFSLPGRKHSGKPEPQTPMNLGAWVLIQDLQTFDQPAAVYRASTEAGEHLQGLAGLVSTASAMVDGEKEDIPSKPYVHYKLAQIEPMTAQEAEEWFPERIGIELKARQIYNWRDRGRLVAVDGKKPPRYRAIDIFKAWENRRTPGYVPASPGVRITAGVQFSTQTS